MSSPAKQTRIFLWCWPRSISTCLEKCLSFVDGVQTWHEPYTAATMIAAFSNKDLLTAGDAQTYDVFRVLVGMLEAMEGQENEFTGGNLTGAKNFTFPWVKSKLEEEEGDDKKYIIIKDVAAFIYDHLDCLPEGPTRHTFIIRHPYRFMTSQRRLLMQLLTHQGIEVDPDSFEISDASPLMSAALSGRDAMRLLWKHVQETGRDPNPVIIDAEDLMNHPDKILPKYLGALGIPFHERYTTWDASEASIKKWKGAMEAVVLGKKMGIYDKALKSSCFLPNTHVMPKREELTEDILGMADNLMPGYEEMYEKRLKPE